MSVNNLTFESLWIIKSVSTKVSLTSPQIVLFAREGDIDLAKSITLIGLVKDFFELSGNVIKGKINGRHDWTRTNDPYHVKVVL